MANTNGFKCEAPECTQAGYHVVQHYHAFKPNDFLELYFCSIHISQWIMEDA